MLFHYSARDSQGKLVTGELEGTSKDAIASLLANRQLTPLEVEVVSAQADLEINLSALLPGPRISSEDLILFSRQMYSLNRAGIPIIRAMRGLADSVRQAQLKKVINDIVDGLESGNDLASCMQKHPTIFSELYVAMIHVGENTGRLELAFMQAAKHLELERETIKRIKSATRYPSFVLLAITIAMVVINIFVIPAFSRVFAKFGADLPWQTQALINTSNFTLAYWPHMVVLVIAGFIAFKRYTKDGEGLVRWDKLKLRFPLVGSIFFRSTLARFCRTFAMMQSAGVPIIQCLTVVSRAAGNAYIGQKILTMRSGIERGESLTRTAAQTQMFSPLVMQMFAVGEETGSVDQLLDEVADFYEQEVDYDLKNLSDAIEPILITFIAGIVLVLALGVFLPMWDLASVTRGR